MPLLTSLIKPTIEKAFNELNNNNEENLDKIITRIAKKELNESEKTKPEALELMRNWIKNNDDIQNVPTDHEFLLRFLRIKKFNVPLAQQMILKYLNLRQHFPHIASHLDYLSPPMCDILQNGYLIVSPHRDRHGRRVTIMNLRLFDATKYTSADMAKAHFLVFESLLCDPINQVLGVTHIVDTEAVTLNHIKIWNPTEFGRILKWTEQSLPMRHKEVHIINAAKGVRWVIEAGKKVISKKLSERVTTYSSLESFQKKFSPEILPIELGGSKYTIKEMAQLWQEEMVKTRDELLSFDNMKILDDRGIIGRRHQEAHRHGGEIQYQKVVGNFRKLEFD